MLREPGPAAPPENAASFSAVAYFFGREIDAHEHVPVGLVDVTWGGTPAESWMGWRRNRLSAPSLRSGQGSRPSRNLAATIALEKLQDEQAFREGKPEHAWHPSPESWAPAGLFNGMILPLTPMMMRGVIGYQGETNSGVDRVAVYHVLFAKLSEVWREKWKQGDFPFLFIQISSFR